VSASKKEEKEGKYRLKWREKKATAFVSRCCCHFVFV
jgi:hypothetical protein